MERLFFATENSQESLNIRSVYEIRDFPNYLSARVSEDKEWGIKSVNTFNGSCINLSGYASAEDYLNKKFSAKRRSKLRTYKRLLDKVFDIKYQQYYGFISKEDYQFILKELHRLISIRFDERNKVHDDLHLWEHYYNIAYQLILNKQAMLFVISDGKKPISIALNLINGDLMFPYIRGFDTDYSKFYPGYIDFTEQIKWAFDQNIQVFDLLKGSYPYKDRLKDHVYSFQKQILFNSSSFYCRIRANTLFISNRLFYALFHFSKQIGVHHLYQQLKTSINRPKNKGIPSIKKYQVEKQLTLPSSEELIPINIDSGSFDYLKQPAYDFLYTVEESIGNIDLYQLKNKPNSFIISNGIENRLITLTPSKQIP